MDTFVPSNEGYEEVGNVGNACRTQEVAMWPVGSAAINLFSGATLLVALHTSPKRPWLVRFYPSASHTSISMQENGFEMFRVISKIHIEIWV